jgi:hypothetical protein
VLTVVAVIVNFSTNKVSAYGSIVSAGGSLLAVIWFTASLWYQARQLNEQRTQFAAQFQHLQESSRRDALQMAKGILEAAEQRAIVHHGGIASIAELGPQYMDFGELKPIMESEDPETVLEAFKIWLKKEGAALTFLRGIKSAAEVYLRSVGVVSEIDFTKPPEEFVYIYGPRFWNQPFFEQYQGAAYLLTEFMIRLEPGRTSAQLAFLAASAKSGHDKYMKMDKIHEDLRKHRERGYPLPKIAEGL